MIEVDPRILDVIDKAVEIGVSKGVKSAMIEYDKIQKNKKKIRYDKRLKNTKVLLENYKEFIEHCENAVFELKKDMEEAINTESNFITLFDEIYDMEDNKTIVKSILKSKTRTIIIVNHIEKCIEFYKYKALSSNNEEFKRRVNVIQMLYLDEINKTYSEIAETLHISTKTVNRDRIKATKELAPLFFGVDGIGLE